MKKNMFYILVEKAWQCALQRNDVENATIFGQAIARYTITKQIPKPIRKLSEYYVRMYSKN